MAAVVARALVVATLLVGVRPARADLVGEDPRSGGWIASVGVGLDVGTPFAEVQLGRRFHAPFELYLDYSYNGTISAYPFHTVGVGVRTYLVPLGEHATLFHQSLAAFGIGTGGHFQTIGDRLLGPFFTMGLGVDVKLHPCWSIAAVLAVGDPVWLRSELAVRYRF